MSASTALSADGDQKPRGRIPILYVAPWVDIGGSDKGTIDWFRWLDRDRFAPSLITTQPSPNRRLMEVFPFAEEVWALPECMAGHQFPGFIFDFLHTRRVPLMHIMNSRLAYELLPDLRCLDFPPAVVVQLHVEEPDRSGYVRYVAARYGNLVDAFSVSSHHLAAALADYDVTTSKIHIIPTGVDAEHEFNPRRVRPVDGTAEPGTFRILFPGRLTGQKDPLLMVEVIRRVVARHAHVRVNVVGDGPLEEEVRRRVREAGIERHVRFHPPTAEPARWLASSHVLLMTSTFEGVPYAAYEALAMKVPVVAPALPGNLELMNDGGGWLIDPRDDADAYAAAITTLIEDEPQRSELGAAGRARMLSSFSLPEMARRHEGLYDGLLASRESPPSEARPSAPHPSLRFTSRPTNTGALVSVVTPCYNHGHYLPALVDSLAAQDYPAIELIVCDDGSDDPHTLEQLVRLEQEGSARVVRQTRGGPSAARNRAIAAASGQYILPVDADNVLLPGAVRSLVEQLQAAGERVGFIYPSVQYFGNRDYCFRPPAYNLYALLYANFADTCSLFDRAVFDAGLRFPEDIALGHEDWDLALSLGARDAIGEPSRSTVMLYRKHGFTRSDLVEYLRLPFSQEIQERHPELFGIRENKDVGAWGRYKGPGLRLKASWNPALAIIASEPVQFGSLAGDALVRAIKNQRCRDFELIAECPEVPRIDGMVVRRVPPGLSGSVAERLEEALSISRARYLLVAQSAAELLADPTIVERLLRSFWIDLELRAIVFADAGGTDRRFPCALLERADPALGVHALAWRRELHDELRDTLVIDEGNELGSLAWIISGLVDEVQWRHFPVSGGGGTSSGGGRQALTLERKPPRVMLDSSLQAEREERLRVAPAIPAMPEHQVRRWDGAPAWMPPETGLLVRLVNEDGTRRLAYRGAPPPGYKIEFHLGSIQRFSPPGTRRLIRRDGHYFTLAPGSAREDNDEELGYLEEAPLPLFIGLERAVLEDGSETLVAASDRDPLRALARELSFLGFIESFPSEPVELPRYTAAAKRPVLVRWIDGAQRRHTYDALLPPYSLDGGRVLGAELGRLLSQSDSTSIPVWLDADGRIGTDRYEFSEPALAPDRMLRYAAAPLNWHGFGTRAGRARSTMRRTVDCQRLLLARVRAAFPRIHAHRALPGGEDQRRPLGNLQSLPAPGFVELFAASHTMLPDQFLTLQPLEAITMGYVDVRSLGYIQADAPLTGTLGGRRAAVSWASRFGLEAHVGG